MIARLAFTALEWAFAAFAVAAAVQAAADRSLLWTGISAAAAVGAGFLRALAFGRAADRRLEASFRGYRARIEPSDGRRS